MQAVRFAISLRGAPCTSMTTRLIGVVNRKEGVEWVCMCACPCVCAMSKALSEVLIVLVAQENNLSLGVIFALQTHSVNAAIAKQAGTDLRNYQWRLNGSWAGKEVRFSS